MEAAEHNIIIEKGADFVFKGEIIEGVGQQKDLTGYTIKMGIKYIDPSDGKVKYLNSFGSLQEEVYEFSGIVENAAAGKFKILIDKSITINFPTMVKSSNKFATEYNYYFYIDLHQNGNEANRNSAINEDIRIVRGRCAIRE